MSRRWLSTAAAAVGIALSIVVAACGPAPAPATPTAPVTNSGDFRGEPGSRRRLIEIEARLTEVTARLDAQTAALERVFESLTALSGSLEMERDRDPGVTRDATAGTLLPGKKPWAFDGLRGWDDDATVRARWMFASAESVLSVLGAPDSVEANREYEEWEYWIPIRGGEDERIWELGFLNGKLVYSNEPKEK